jgi:hypothetical protein
MANLLAYTGKVGSVRRGGPYVILSEAVQRELEATLDLQLS